MKDDNIIQLVQISLSAIGHIITSIFKSKKKKEKTNKNKHKKTKKKDL